VPKQDRSIFARLLLLLAVLALVAAACSSGDDEKNSSGEIDDGGSEQTGGELVDLGTFAGGAPEHLDPALNTTVEAYQVVNQLYDGLTDLDSSDPANPQVKPLVAESYEANDDGTVWTFTIGEDEVFSNGEPVLPSSFVRAWERASDPDLNGGYSYLFNFIKGGAEKLDGTAETLAGLTADDASRTLTVELARPYANFDIVAGYQTFSPMPKAVEELDDPASWDDGLMIGNGAYKLAEARTDTEIVLVRNDRWSGNVLGNTRAILDKITFKVSDDVDAAYSAFENGEADTALIPPARVDEADENYGTTLDVALLGSYHYTIRMDHPVLGGAENLKLREAITMAVNREEINTAAYNGSRTPSTGVTPPGIPGFERGLCGELCEYDPDGARARVEEWKAAGHSLTAPLKIQIVAGTGAHELVAQILVDNLESVGIDAVADPRQPTTYFSDISDGACVICQSGWYADYPSYDNFMYDLFHKDAIGRNNFGAYDDAEFNSLVDRAKSTVDKDDQADLFHQAERRLLQDVGVIPLLWYRGNFVYHEDRVASFEQTNLGLVLWDQVRLE
jgi:oligopeptide transport system substrate-binding protein